jgi:hypothetical protein
MDWWEDEFCELLAAGDRFVIRYDLRDTRPVGHVRPRPSRLWPGGAHRRCRRPARRASSVPSTRRWHLDGWRDRPAPRASPLRSGRLAHADLDESRPRWTGAGRPPADVRRARSGLRRAGWATRLVESRRGHRLQRRKPAPVCGLTRRRRGQRVGPRGAGRRSYARHRVEHDEPLDARRRRTGAPATRQHHPADARTPRHGRSPVHMGTAKPWPPRSPERSSCRSRVSATSSPAAGVGPGRRGHPRPHPSAAR